MTDAPGSLFGELVNLTRDSGQYPFLVTSLSPPSCTLPCSPNVHDADSFLLGIGYCKPVFGCTEVRCSFSGISSISVRPNRCSWWFGCLPCRKRLVWEDSRGPHCNTDSIQLADGPDMFSTVKIFFGVVHVQSHAHVRSQKVHRHVLRVAPVAPTSGVRVQRNSSLKHHQQVCSSSANGGADARRPRGGHWKRHKWALVLDPLAVQSLRSGSGRTQQQEGDAVKSRS